MKIILETRRYGINLIWRISLVLTMLHTGRGLIFLQQLFGCLNTSLGHWQGRSLTHPKVNHCVILVPPEYRQEPQVEVGHQKPTDCYQAKGIFFCNDKRIRSICDVTFWHSEIFQLPKNKSKCNVLQHNNLITKTDWQQMTIPRLFENTMTSLFKEALNAGMFTYRSYMWTSSLNCMPCVSAWSTCTCANMAKTCQLLIFMCQCKKDMPIFQLCVLKGIPIFQLFFQRISQLLNISIMLKIWKFQEYLGNSWKFILRSKISLKKNLINLKTLTSFFSKAQGTDLKIIGIIIT